MTRVHVVHGIYSSFGKASLEALIPYLRAAGFDVPYPDYGWIWGLETRIANPLIVHSILPYIAPGDLFVGHSNGCAIGYDLMGLKAPLSGAVFINAALQRRISRPPHVQWMDVYFNPGDDATEVARWAEAVGLVDPSWGEMGHAGYEGTDPGIVNINCGNTPGLPRVSGHSDFFTPGKLPSWAPYLVKRILEHLQPCP